MSPFAQLLSVGLVWITFHCAGMCGPIVVGLDVAGAARGVSAARGALSILIYQAGRATTLATLGALAGLGGHTLKRVFEPGAAVFSLLFGLALLAVTLIRALPRRQRPARPRLSIERGAAPSMLKRLSRWLQTLSFDHRPMSLWLLGALMAFMPCMIVIWALGLAGTSASPLEGAALMVTLVAMTTPVLLGATLAPRIIPLKWRARMPTILLSISGCWLVLVGLAGLELVPHAHATVWGHMIMFW